MDSLEEFYSNIQSLLIKKNSECDGLKFISSKITEENAKHVDEICNGIKQIFESFKIPINDNASLKNDKCIKSFEYLIFNTFFECQENLAEDIVKGHLVDMCPPLSPYLLISIINHINYQDILAESILHFPLELCTEINQNVRTYLTLMNYERAQGLLTKLILNSCQKLIIMKKNNIQSLNIEVGLSNFSISISELIIIFTEKKLVQLNIDENSNQTEKQGLMLKNLINLCKICIENEQKDLKINEENEKMYKVTFGRNFEVKCDAESLNNKIIQINIQLLNLLSLNLQEIDVNSYLDWASYDSPEDSSLSLQQSIGNDCYNFLEILNKNDNKHCSQLLINCLKQLSSKPKDVLNSTLKDLCKGIEAGNRECMKQLMTHQQDWNSTIFEYIKKNSSMLDKNDLCNVLEYLISIIGNNDLETHIRDVFNIVTKVFMSLSIKDVYDVTLGFILKYDAKNILESANTEEMFNIFIIRANLKNLTNLKMVLFFLMKNPEKFLILLIKMSIGHPDYKNVMIPPEDLLLLSSIMKINCDENGGKFILKVLKKVGLEPIEWEFKKYSKLILTMIEENLFTADEILNIVFIPMLNDGQIPSTSVKSILHVIIKLFPQLSDQLKMNDFMLALAKRMQNQRKNVKFPKHINDELLMMLIKIIRSFLHHHKEWIEEAKRGKTVAAILKKIYPIDQIYYSPLVNGKKTIDVTDIMADYLRRTRITLMLINDMKEPIINPDDFSEDFQLHLILNCTDKEYVRIGGEISVVHWDYFVKNPLEMDENDGFVWFMKLTTKAFHYYLQLSDLTPPQSFSCLIKSFVNFFKNILQLDNNNWDYKKMFNCCKENFLSLNSDVCNTEYDDYYKELMDFMIIIDNEQTISLESLLNVVDKIDHFGNMCLQTSVKIRSVKPNKDITKHLICQEIIGLCLNYENEHARIIVKTINKLQSEH